MKKFNFGKGFMLAAAAVAVFAVAVIGCEQATEVKAAEPEPLYVRNRKALQDALTRTDIKSFTVSVSLNTNHEITVTSEKVITIPAGVAVALKSLDAQASVTVIGPKTDVPKANGALLADIKADNSNAGIILIKKAFNVAADKKFGLTGEAKLAFASAVTAADAVVDGTLKAESPDAIFWVAEAGDKKPATRKFSGGGTIQTSAGGAAVPVAEAKIEAQQNEALQEILVVSGGDDDDDGPPLGTGPNEGEDDNSWDDGNDDYVGGTVDSITLSPTTLKMTEIDETQQLTVTFDPAEMSSSGIIWTSDKPSVASVNANGLVTAKALGTATITAKSKVGGKTASCEVTVSAGLEAGLYKNDVLIDVTNEVGDNLLAKSFKWIKDNETLEEEEYKIVLDADITVNTGFSIGTGPTGSSTGNADKNKNITITLQGLTTTRTITMDGKSALFTVYGKDATDVPHLILDENITLKGYSNNNSALVVIGDINKTGKLTMMAGSRITGNTTTTTGGGVYVLGGGTFDMEGGSIDNNQTTNSGGGVYADTFTMSGGSIENNSAGTTTSPGSGGGVYAGTFTMSGGVIKNNNCVELNDGVAAENFSNAFGGGVYVGGTFTMSGNAEISDNSAEIGGGVVVPLSTFDMQGGTIAKNRASIAGAAVAVSEYANKFSKSGGIIYGVTGTNANKSADGIGANVHSIAIYSSYNDYWEYEPSAKFYYDDTANTGTALDSTQTGTNWIAVP